MLEIDEGLPMTLLDAMAAANIEVASHLSSISEVVGEAGLHFTPGESSELADALLQVIGDDDLHRKKGQLAREIVKERFSWSGVLPQLESLYVEVVAE